MYFITPIDTKVWTILLISFNPIYCMRILKIARSLVMILTIAMGRSKGFCFTTAMLSVRLNL